MSYCYFRGVFRTQSNIYNKSFSWFLQKDKNKCITWNLYIAKNYFSGPHFSAFGQNTERYGVSLCIQSKCRKMRTRKTPYTDIFQVVHICTNLIEFHLNKQWYWRTITCHTLCFQWIAKLKQLVLSVASLLLTFFRLKNSCLSSLNADFIFFVWCISTHTVNKKSPWFLDNCDVIHFP